jgi:hypothetical protein
MQKSAYVSSIVMNVSSWNILKNIKGQPPLTAENILESGVHDQGNDD